MFVSDHGELIEQWPASFDKLSLKTQQLAIQIGTEADILP